MGPTLDLNFPEVPENREALSQLVHRLAKVVRDLILVGEVLDHAGLPRAVLQEEEVEGLELSPVLPGIPVVVSDHRPPSCQTETVCSFRSWTTRATKGQPEVKIRLSINTTPAVPSGARPG